MTHIEPQASRQGISLARAASGPDGLAQTAKQTLFGAAPLRTFFLFTRDILFSADGHRPPGGDDSPYHRQKFAARYTNTAVA